MKKFFKKMKKEKVAWGRIVDLWVLFPRCSFLLVAPSFDKSVTNKPTDGPTDGPTDRPTGGPTDSRQMDKASFKDTRMHLKMSLLKKKKGLSNEECQMSNAKMILRKNVKWMLNDKIKDVIRKKSECRTLNVRWQIKDVISKKWM